MSFVGVPHWGLRSTLSRSSTWSTARWPRPPVRRYLPELIDLVLNGKSIRKVFDLTLRSIKLAEGYRAMDGRRAIKTLLNLPPAE